MMKTLKTRGLHPVAHLTIAYMSHAALLLELWAGVTFKMITMMMMTMMMVMMMMMAIMVTNESTKGVTCEVGDNFLGF